MVELLKDYRDICDSIEIYIQKHIDTQNRIIKLYEAGETSDSSKDLGYLLEEFKTERITVLNLEKRRRDLAVKLAE